MQNSLDSKVFQDELDFKTLENILETLDHVTPKKVSRSDFNARKGNFLVETGEDKLGKSYDLFLPEDLKVYELPSIISRINKITFGEILPDYASKEELKLKTTLTINVLFQVLSEKRGNESEKHEIQRAIKKYVQLFEDMYGIKEAQKLSNDNYRNEIIEKSKATQGYEKFREYQAKLEKIKTREKLDELLSKMENNISQEITKHFTESFFERGINMLRLGMMTITEGEQISLKGKGVKSTEEIDFRLSNQELDKKERLLSQKIGMNVLKTELAEVRKSGNQKKIHEAELKATNKIISVLYEYPYQSTQNNHGYQPNKIAEFKEIYCVGFSLLGHAFLTELGIKHYGLQIPKHSALEVLIGGKKYYFDGTASNKVHEFIYGEKLGEYRKIVLKNIVSKNNNFAQRGKVENILLSQIYNNKGTSLLELGKYKEAIELYNKAIELNPSNGSLYSIKGTSLLELGKYEEAIESCNFSIIINPKSFRAYTIIGDALFKLGRYEEAIKSYDKAIVLEPLDSSLYGIKGTALLKLGKYEEAIESCNFAIIINPKSFLAYRIIGDALFKLGRYEEAIESYNNALELNPKTSFIYKNIGTSLEIMGKSKLANIYVYTSLLIKGDFTSSKHYEFKEKAQIKQLIDSRNFEGLRLYLLELEKQDN